MWAQATDMIQGNYKLHLQLHHTSTPHKVPKSHKPHSQDEYKEHIFVKAPKWLCVNSVTGEHNVCDAQ